MTTFFAAMKNLFHLRRRPLVAPSEIEQAARVALFELVDYICNWLHIIDPTKHAVVRMFQNSESRDPAWRHTLANLKTAGHVFDAMIELNVTNEKILRTVFGAEMYEALRVLSIAEAREPLKHPS